MLPARRGTTYALLVAACAWGCNDSPSDPAFFTSQTRVLEPRAAAWGQPGDWSARPLAEAAHFTTDETSAAPPLAAPGLFGPPPSVDALAICAPEEPAATLLPPVELPPLDDAESIAAPLPGEAVAVEANEPAAELVANDPASPPPVVAAPPLAEAAAHPQIDSPVAEAAPEAEMSITDAALSAEKPVPALVGSPTGAVISKRAEAKIRRGYELVKHGATFAAKNEFIDVLQLIAEAKDQKHGSPRRTIALANGLRAIDEAADFETRGAAGAAGANVALIISAHRTPAGQSEDAKDLMPAQLADRYLQYAQLQLGASVAGEPAGSMALHALGKLHTQLARTEPENHPQAEREALAFQQAAILARQDNYLAVHELGVLLAESGHYGEAEQVLGDVARRQPNEVVLRNLARVQHKLGRDQLAAATEQQAQQFASRNGASAHGVVWVNSATLASTGDATAPPRSIAAMPPPANNPYAPAPAAASHAPPAQSAKRDNFGWFR
jgi:hypothetical protein